MGYTLGSRHRGLKPKTRDNLSTLSRFVPLTLPNSNSFYENVDELYVAKCLQCGGEIYIFI